MMARWVGVDYGSKRIGLAVGDSQSRIASPLMQVSAGKQVAQRVLESVRQYQAAGVVVGWPLNQDGGEGPQARLARRFAADLVGRTGLEVRLWDERLSSFEADQRLRGQFTRRQKKRRHDSVAAAALLEDFLARGGPETAPRVERATPEEGK
jgi:putative Holliday junction resolvase